MRFAAHRLAGLSDEPRPGAPRTSTDEQVKRVVTATLEQVPPNRKEHWITETFHVHNENRPVDR